MGVKHPGTFPLVTKMERGPLFKINSSAVNGFPGEIIWYRRNGDPGRLEESFKISGQQNNPQNVYSGGRTFEQ